MIFPAIASTADAAAPTGGAAARRADGWEFALQNGRAPKGAAEQAEFSRFLCRQLEAVLIGTMLQAARKASPANGLLSGGFAGSMYQGLADEEFARAAAASGGFGLGDAIYNQMAARISGARAYARTAAEAAPQGTSGKSDN